jgi:hypothetical protein
MITLHSLALESPFSSFTLSVQLYKSDQGLKTIPMIYTVFPIVFRKMHEYMKTILIQCFHRVWHKIVYIYI